MIENIKNKIIIEYKAYLLVFICLTVAFTAGFGMGNYKNTTGFPKERAQVNYTTNPTTEPTSANKTTMTDMNTTKSSNDTLSLQTECKIKGNISGKSKIYHVHGGAFYERTTAEMCFETEEEAVTAGFIKSSR